MAIEDEDSDDDYLDYIDYPDDESDTEMDDINDRSTRCESCKESCECGWVVSFTCQHEFRHVAMLPVSYNVEPVVYCNHPGVSVAHLCYECEADLHEEKERHNLQVNMKQEESRSLLGVHFPNVLRDLIHSYVPNGEACPICEQVETRIGNVH